MSGPAPVVCVYRFKADVGDPAVHDLLRRHRAALVRGDFTTPRLPVVMRSLADPRVFVEIFDWRSEERARKAASDPLVQAVRREFAELCETVGLPFGRLPEAERPFCHFASFDVTYAAPKPAKAPPKAGTAATKKSSPKSKARR